ncbi:AAA family ATPase [Sediminivirga luteola]|uniref:AAA family ATPase n=1 Tax=Sediminivirga luteola TaxID=1774748 RepID=UPI001F560658|nr:AAA family ATPase [Sediminivirga luteola]MCI2266372.1 AAA family ATPase [Sediminivirga luteola]
METTSFQRSDPRDMLSGWANASDEWVRYIVRHVLVGAGPLSSDEAAGAYSLFRQEKAFDGRELPTEEPLATLDAEDETIEPLTLTSMSQVVGVNALVEGGVIEPHAGLTILFGENGTGKTGYSRIFKALAASRTADVILGNIEATAPKAQSALIEYTLGAEAKTYTWTGSQGVAPFTRMSIFDSPSVSFHIDDDLEYVYVPAALALFNHVIAGIKSVQAAIDGNVKELRSGPTGLLSRFPRTATVYPLIETLGASTDLEHLKSLTDTSADVDTRIAGLRRTVAALEADTISAEIKLQQRVERILKQASDAAMTVAGFNVDDYNSERDVLHGLQEDYRSFRTALFEAADLPADPDDTWSTFITAGEAYQSHLIELDAHDESRCLYCRQPLNESARALISKYSEYLADKITADITASEARIDAHSEPIISLRVSDAMAFAAEYADTEDKPQYHFELDRTLATVATLIDRLRAQSAVESALTEHATVDALALAASLTTTANYLDDLKGQAATRLETLATKKKELVELEAGAELAKSWALIEAYVRDAKQADRLTLLAKPMPGLLRAVTGLAKTASDQMINESFDTLFSEECVALRAPTLDIEFVGRQGRAQRRKVLTGKHKPSTVLSEGEQKVLAMADFLAEARLAGITAPVIFDDPVSSLDHRRINEVAQRVTLLAETTQVIVFTHDIFFASTLLALMETSKRCAYFHITDEEGKGKITRATGPRWDSLNNIKKNINETIQAAGSQDGDARAALVRTGYDWVRAWCEVFTETELLQGVTQRYQPNVRMTNLPKIKSEALPTAIETVNRIFEDACRYIDGHSQPLPTLGVSPTLAGLEAHWAELTTARTTYLNADG